MKQQTQNTRKSSLFINKLQEILSDNTNSNVILWTKDGTSFEIKNLKNFQDHLLPKYFRHNRMSSFVRQLNMYGFYKSKTNKDTIVFSHDNFHRDNLQNAVVIRKPQGHLVIKKDFAKTPTQHSSTLLSLNESPSRQNIITDANQQQSNLTISQLMLQLINEINYQNLILDCDIKSRVQQLLRTQTYKIIDKKFIPFILNSLGVDSQPSSKNIGNINFNSQFLLKSFNFIESLQFII